MPKRNDGTSEQDDAWLREQIAEIVECGWTLEELETIGISRAMLTRLGFRDDHPRLFDEPVPRRRSAPPPGAPRPHHGTEAASPVHRDAASAFQPTCTTRGGTGDESPGWNHGKAAEAGSRNARLDPESAQADFGCFQRRIHSLLEGGRADARTAGLGACLGQGSHVGRPYRIVRPAEVEQGRARAR